jgi:hypothetical protein
MPRAGRLSQVGKCLNKLNFSDAAIDEIAPTGGGPGNIRYFSG